VGGDGGCDDDSAEGVVMTARGGEEGSVEPEGDTVDRGGSGVAVVIVGAIPDSNGGVCAWSSRSATIIAIGGAGKAAGREGGKVEVEAGSMGGTDERPELDAFSNVLIDERGRSSLMLFKSSGSSSSLL
jgi:hypothetical protein